MAFDSAEGVGASIARDLARSGSKTRHLVCARHTAFSDEAAGSRQIVSKLDSYALRAESNARRISMSGVAGRIESDVHLQYRGRAKEIETACGDRACGCHTVVT